MEERYRSLKEPAEGIYREKGSRFLAFGFPVENGEEIKTILSGIRKKYHDARHHCYAYRLGIRKEAYRVNDDGEPSGTAGRPIYGQLVSNNLTNTLVVVVRYFGGTLLGTGGLINAYRQATADMLSRAIVIERQVEARLQISFPYEALNSVMRIMKEEELLPLDPHYNTICSMYVMVQEKLLKATITRLLGIPGLVIDSLKNED
jgi:uncharacterized YigZ family protein